MRKIELKTWSWWRATRLLLGVLFAVVGLMRADLVLAFSGFFLVIHAVINSCEVCATGTCDVPQNKQS